MGFSSLPWRESIPALRWTRDSTELAASLTPEREEMQRRLVYSLPITQKLMVETESSAGYPRRWMNAARCNVSSGSRCTGRCALGDRQCPSTRWVGLFRKTATARRAEAIWRTLSCAKKSRPVARYMPGSCELDSPGLSVVKPR